MDEATQYKEDLRIAIEELHLRYGYANGDYDQLQNKFFALLAGELALITLLFGFADPTRILLSQAYDKVFLGFGLVCLAIALAIAFVSARSTVWAKVPEMKRILDNVEIKAHPGIELLERIKEDYEVAINYCEEKHSKRTRQLDWSIRLFVVGAIILLVFKI